MEYKWTVEIYEEPLTEPEILEGTADDYEEAVENAVEMSEGSGAPYQTVITIERGL